MWNKYFKSNERERKRLLAEHLTGLKIGCVVKTNKRHNSYFKTSFNGIVDDIDLETGILNIIIPTKCDKLVKIHMGWLDKIN